MTTNQYHSKFFPDDPRWTQLGIRSFAISCLKALFECPKRPPSDSLKEVKLVKVLYYYILLGRDTSCWHELAICKDKTELMLWRDIHYGNVIAKH